jgi:hypothetical protein
MFQPSQHDVRRFFCESYRLWHQRLPMDPMHERAARWIAEHPQYHAELADLDQALDTAYRVEDGRTNPFLHLSMHLSLDEQSAIDQPSGIRQALQQLTRRMDSEHEAHHAAMECLGEMIWQSQRSGLPPDGMAYLEGVRRLASGPTHR